MSSFISLIHACYASKTELAISLCPDALGSTPEDNVLTQILKPIIETANVDLLQWFVQKYPLSYRVKNTLTRSAVFSGDSAMLNAVTKIVGSTSQAFWQPGCLADAVHADDKLMLTYLFKNIAAYSNSDTYQDTMDTAMSLGHSDLLHWLWDTRFHLLPNQEASSLEKVVPFCE